MKNKKKYEEFRTALEQVISQSQSIFDFFRKVKAIEPLKQGLRKELQTMVNRWAKEDGHTHPPVYISYRPKISVAGRYFPKGWTGGIVIFVLNAPTYPCDPEDLEIANFEKVLDILKHEYIHHLLRNTGLGVKGSKHTQFFYETLKKRFGGVDETL